MNERGGEGDGQEGAVTFGKPGARSQAPLFL